MTINHDDYRPSDPAPHSGSYQAIEALGYPTGFHVKAQEGEPLPMLPIGFTWQPIGQRIWSARNDD